MGTDVRPAHGLSDPVIDPEYLVQQVELLEAICDSLRALRALLMRHPQCQAWRADDQLTDKLYRM